MREPGLAERDCIIPSKLCGPLCQPRGFDLRTVGPPAIRFALSVAAGRVAAIDLGVRGAKKLSEVLGLQSELRMWSGSGIGFN